MAPSSSNETLYLNHIVVPSEVPLALCISWMLLMLMFLALYVFCCFEAFRGKLDFYKIPAEAPQVKFVNPFKNINIPFTKRNSSVGIVLQDYSAQNHTDSDNC